MLLARSDDWDWALVRLNAPPPAGVHFSALARRDRAGVRGRHRASTTRTATSRSGRRGPRRATSTCDDGTGASFVRMRWNQGTTEVGSSGAGLFTYYGAGGYYELRGGLFGGDSSCSARAELDYFSRLDQALPYLRQYLTPNAASPRGVVPVIEFYNRTLGHYFISTNPVEINNLDTGVLRGWERTGLALPRLFGSGAGAGGNDARVPLLHAARVRRLALLFGAVLAECAETAARFGAAWIYESPNVFYIQLPEPGDRRLPGGHAAGLALPQHLQHQPPLHGRGAGSRRPAPHPRAGSPKATGPDAVIMCAPRRDCRAVQRRPVVYSASAFICASVSLAATAAMIRPFTSLPSLSAPRSPALNAFSCA